MGVAETQARTDTLTTLDILDILTKTLGGAKTLGAAETQARTDTLTTLDILSLAETFGGAKTLGVAETLARTDTLDLLTETVTETTETETEMCDPNFGVIRSNKCAVGRRRMMQVNHALVP
jgi:hypothetical protein